MRSLIVRADHGSLRCGWQSQRKLAEYTVEGVYVEAEMSRQLVYEVMKTAKRINLLRSVVALFTTITAKRIVQSQRKGLSKPTGQKMP